MSRTRRHLLVVAAVGLTLLLAGCGGDGGDSAAAAEPVATTQVSVEDNEFGPPAIEIAPGDTVTWTWAGDADHNVVGDGFQSDVQSEGTFEHRFDEPGTYAYQCTLHAGMQGTVIVGGAAAESSEGA